MRLRSISDDHRVPASGMITYRAVQWKMQIDGRVPDPAGNDDTQAMCVAGLIPRRVYPSAKCVLQSIDNASYNAEK